MPDAEFIIWYVIFWFSALAAIAGGILTAKIICSWLEKRGSGKSYASEVHKEKGKS
jgi:hypothetical protein